MTRKINEYSEQIPDSREQRAAKSPEQEAQDKRGEMVDLLKSMSNALDALVYYATPSRGIAAPGIEKSVGSSLTQLGGMSETQIKGSELKQIVQEEFAKLVEGPITAKISADSSGRPRINAVSKAKKMARRGIGTALMGAPYLAADKAWDIGYNKLGKATGLGANPEYGFGDLMSNLGAEETPATPEEIAARKAALTPNVRTGMVKELPGQARSVAYEHRLKQIVQEELSKLLNEQGNPAYLSTPRNPVDRDGDGYPDHYDTRGQGVTFPGDGSGKYNPKKAMRAQSRKYKDIPLPPASVTPNEENPLFVTNTPAAQTGPVIPAPDSGDTPTAPPIEQPASNSADQGPIEALYRQQLALDIADPNWGAYLKSKQEQESGADGVTAENERTGAYGLFQIIPDNWSGKGWKTNSGVSAMTPQERQKIGKSTWPEEAALAYGLPIDALSDPKDRRNQYLVSRHKMQEYYDEYSQYKPEDSPTGGIFTDIAAAWYSGPGHLPRAHRAKQAQNAGEEPSARDLRALKWLGKMGTGMRKTKKNPKGEPWVGQYVDDVRTRMNASGGNSSGYASNSMLVPDHEATMEEQPMYVGGQEPPRMIHVPGRGYVAVDDLADEREAEEIQFQPIAANIEGTDFADPEAYAPMDQQEIDQLVALGMLDDEASGAPDTAAVDANYGGGTPDRPPVQYDIGPSAEPTQTLGHDHIQKPIEPAEYVGTPPPPSAPEMDADTQDALARTSDTGTGDRRSAGGWCAEGEIQIQGQCINISQLLGGLAENKQNLKELVKEEIKQLIISKSLDLKGNK